jgi:hypothetical protein
MNKQKLSEEHQPSLIKKLLPYIGLIVMTAFTLGSIFFGFMRLKVDCTRPNAETLPNCEINESRFFGLYSRSANIEKVSDIGYKTSVGNKNMLQSTLVLVGENAEVPLSDVSTNFGSWKANVFSQTENYLLNKSETELKIDYFDWNILGLIGVALTLMFIASVLYYVKNLLFK